MRAAAPARALRLSTAAAAALALTLSLAGCAGTGDPAPTARPVTAEESELLAAMRFRNFDAGARAVSFDVVDGGTDLAFDGWFDFTSSVGYGSLTEGGAPNSLLLWNTETVGVHAPSDAGTAAPLPIPDADALDTSWRGGPLDPSSSRLHAALAVVGSLGADRPDNPLLLRQGGALWLGEEQVDGVDVTVFAGPLADGPLPSGQAVDPDTATVRYWVDADGVLHRASVRLGGGGDWTTIELSDADGVTLGDPFAPGSAP